MLDGFLNNLDVARASSRLRGYPKLTHYPKFGPFDRFKSPCYGEELLRP